MQPCCLGLITLSTASFFAEESRGPILALLIGLEEPVSLSPWAIAAGIVALVGILFALCSLRSRIHRKRHVLLESQVSTRTKELEEKSDRLASTIEELQATQAQLVESARLSGKAEVATTVLHNVGNVLNSLGIATNVLNERLEKSKISSLAKTAELLRRHENDLGSFFTTDPRGRKLPEYLEQLSLNLENEHAFYKEELLEISEHLQHAINIVSSQQRAARRLSPILDFNLKDVIQNALRISLTDDWRSRIEIAADIPDDIPMTQDQNAILQVITNFVKNSAESIIDANQGNGLIEISARQISDSDRVEIVVKDSGGGFEKSASEQLFTMGYTTKSYGHGFGMHAAANATKKIGGAISLTSDGPGLGAVARLEIPRIDSSAEEKEGASAQ